jgi:hypothetical protein
MSNHHNVFEERRVLIEYLSIHQNHDATAREHLALQGDQLVVELATS